MLVAALAIKGVAEELSRMGQSDGQPGERNARRLVLKGLLHGFKTLGAGDDTLYAA